MAPKATKLMTKALNAMKKKGFSQKIVRPIVKQLLDVYNGNWFFIEDDNYRALIDAILESEEQKEQSSELENLLNDWSEEESEEDEPLLKRPKRSNEETGKSSSEQQHDKGSKGKDILVKQEKGSCKSVCDEERDESKSSVPFVDLVSSGDESDSSCGVSEKRMIAYKRGQSFRKERGNDLALEEKKVNVDEDDEAALFGEPLYRELPGFEVPLPLVLPDSPLLLLQGSSSENCSTPKENHSTSPEVMDLDAEDICTTPLLLKDAYPTENSSDLEANHPKSRNNEKTEPQDSMNLDIASSSKGEVKIFLTISSSLRSNCHVPSLEALFKQVEEQCLKSCKIPPTDFSMSKLMQEVCESFLIAGTTSAHTDDVISITCPAGNISNHQPIKIQIPRFVGPVHLDFSRCKIFLSETERNLMELSCKTFLLPQQHSYHYTADITNSQESNEISLINEVNEDGGPTFNYISTNLIYRNADVKFCLARIGDENCCSKCVGDCLSLQIPCNCAGKSVGECAYTPGGLLNETFLDNFVLKNEFVQQKNLFYCGDCPLERPNDRKLYIPCNGHIIRKFIKECCWFKCGCTMKCGNRVVQRGITAKLQVFMTAEQKGWGVRTLEEIPKGAFICEYVGEVVTTKELYERDVKKDSGDSATYSVLLDAGWSSKRVLKDEEALCLDATVHGNVARFINHRCCDANLVDIPVEVETPDHHYYRDYGFDFNDNDFECRCGSKFCRDRKPMKRKLISREKPSCRSLVD